MPVPWHLTDGHRHWLAILVVSLGGLGFTGISVFLDMVASIQDPYGLDYGEGIVWQQTTLMPGPLMYKTGQALPFIVFHYPPVYYLVTHAAASFMPDLLSAGRLVSSASTLAIIPLVALLVLVGGQRAGSKRPATLVFFAIFAGVLAFNLHVVRTWGLLMRVDMLSVALSLSGVLTAALANARLRGTTCALLLCLAAVYCKQTQLPAGIAVFLVTLLRRPKVAAAAAGIALTAGLAALSLMQSLTSGGFLQHIIGYNINRFALENMLLVFRLELVNFPVMLTAFIAAGSLMWGLCPLRPLSELRQRLADRGAATRAMVLLYFTVASLLLITTCKSGATSNYLIDWLCIGCASIGIWLSDSTNLARKAPVALVVSLAALLGPTRLLPDRLPPAELDSQAVLVRRIADAAKPVASEDMVLLMRAGKQVVYEPAIVTELSALGHWDEGPLVHMIDSGGFAFMITSDNGAGPTKLRSPAVDASMRRALPRIEPVGRGLWLHLPK